MVDFINEVDEDVRAQQVRDTVRKVLPWAIGLGAALLIAVAGWFGYEAWRSNAVSEASQAYNRGLMALQAERPDRIAAEAAFKQVSEMNGAPIYKSLALMQRAGMAVQENKIPEGVKLFDEAAKAAPDPIIADIASLKAAYLILDTAPLADLQVRLTPLSAEGRPMRPLAREALALALLNAGRTQEARTEFAALGGSLDSPEGLQARAKAAIEMIDSGAAKKLPAIAKAAIAQGKTPGEASPFTVSPAGPAPAPPPAGAAPQ